MKETPKDLQSGEMLDAEEARQCEKNIIKIASDFIKSKGSGGSYYIPEILITLAESKKLPWNKLLYEYLQQKEDDETSYLTPERKYIHMDLIIPAFWDTSVSAVYKNIRSADKILKCVPKTTGGTDINCIYQYIRSENIKPVVMLILTDGYFGKLNENIGKLRSNTILVISNNGAKIDKSNNIGKLARL